jgi:hypothetical protein
MMSMPHGKPFLMNMDWKRKAGLGINQELDISRIGESTP